MLFARKKIQGRKKQEWGTLSGAVGSVTSSVRKTHYPTFGIEKHFNSQTRRTRKISSVHLRSPFLYTFFSFLLLLSIYVKGRGTPRPKTSDTFTQVTADTASLKASFRLFAIHLLPGYFGVATFWLVIAPRREFETQQ
ncbi:hypothetical protein AVEN_86748-1 [Araneus ventricosus]|uniref:Uncharacterized protein n=1 Tax=Araneus ventricosus TaxID=182803 RepID=A0A4Y2VU98_ARAVE|nr:hypothetical protein AVEN_28569-1 [Araneus ventricosus]GBO27676.1 hypothetical protein AVEN_208555-1 [Araneus ventricosus]GBO27694.1 hypothetical protein AVEN_86748-1 [Araneus ventricosus]